MAKLHGLIKLRQHELDEKRRELGEINAKIEALEQKKKQMLDRMEAEKQAAADNVMLASTIGAYIGKTLKRRESLTKQIQKIIVESEELMEEVREAFLELKKFEITQNRRDAEELARLEKLEQAVLDEIAIVRHGREKLLANSGHLK